MKSSITLIALLLTLFVQAQSETSVFLLKIDFKNKQLSPVNNKALRKAEFIQLQVDSLPPGQYKIGFNKTDSFISAGSAPALFGALSFGDGFSGLLSGLAAYSIRSLGNVAITPEQMEIITNPNFQNALKNTGVEIFPSLTKNGCDGGTALKKLQDEKRQQIFDHYFSFRDEVIKPADRLFNLLELKKNPAEDSSAVRINTLRIIDKRLELEKNLEQLFKEYYDKILENSNYTLIANCSNLKVADSLLVSYKKGFNTFLAKFDTTFNEAAMVKVYKRLTASQAPVRYVSLPQSIHGDIVKMNIDINGIDQTKTPQNYSADLSVNKYPNRLFSFTSGVYVSSLHNQEFSIATNVRPNATNPAKLDTLNYSIREEANNNVEAGIMALLHYGCYFSKNVGAFVAFGPGLSFEKNPKPRIALGAGLMIGRTNRFAVSGGVIAGSVKRLASSYNTTSTYNPAPADITTDKFESSWYLSLGYSLWGK